jgi:hypothetical protein
MNVVTVAAVTPTGKRGNSGSVSEAGHRRICGMPFPKTTVMAAVPAASGIGRILFSQLDLQRRVDPASASYDPVPSLSSWGS